MRHNLGQCGRGRLRGRCGVVIPQAAATVGHALSWTAFVGPALGADGEHGGPLVGCAAGPRLAQACEQSPGGALLVGPAGIGKSRLLAEALAAWKRGARPSVVLRAGPRPRSHSRPCRRPFGSRGRRDRSARLLSAAERLLFEQFGPGLVLGVDDAHWLDDVSAALVFRLARRQGVTLLVAARDGEAFAADALEALWKDELLVRLDVGPLELAEVGQLLETVVGGLAADRTKREFYARSRGNPLFLRELILDASEHNELAAVDGVWVWSGEVHGGARLTTLIERRISGLAPNERELLELLLSCSSRCPSTLRSRSSTSSRSSGRSAPRSGDPRRADSLRLGHPLYGDIIRNQLPLATRRRYVRRLAKTIERAAPRPEPVLSLAALAVESGGGGFGAASRCGRRAGKCAQRSESRRASRPCRVGREPTDFHARFSLGEALEGQERWAEAEETLGSLEGSEPDDASILRDCGPDSVLQSLTPTAPRPTHSHSSARSAARRRPGRCSSQLRASSCRRGRLRGRVRSQNRSCVRPTSIRTRLLAAQVAGMAMAMGDAPLQAAVVADEFHRSRWSLPTCLRAVGWMVLVSWLGHFLAGEVEQDSNAVRAFRRDEHLVDALSGSLYLFIGRIELASGHAHSATLALTHAVARLRVSDRANTSVGPCRLLAAARGLAGDMRRPGRSATRAARRSSACESTFEADRLLRGGMGQRMSW